MRGVYKSILWAATGCLLGGTGLARPVTWALSAAFDDGGVASGFFVYDADTDTISNWGITTTAGRALSSFEYAPSNSRAGDFQGIFVFSSNQLFPGCCGVEEARVLRLGFSGPLTNAGGIVTLTQGLLGQHAGTECLDCNPFRLITAGSIISLAPAPTVSFFHQDVPAGVAALTMTSADFNGDGRLDLAMVTVPGWGVSVLLGLGGGKFDFPRGVMLGVPRAGFIAAADFNSDGKIDLAVTNLEAHTVSVALGFGDGTFRAARQFPAGTWPWQIAAADFNGDGRLDLAVTNFQGLVPGIPGATVSVLPGQGDGSFGPPLSSAVLGTRPDSLAVGDFNGDAKMDLMVATQDLPAQVSVLVGRGDGTFQARPVTFMPSATPVVVADFNLDGKLDLAVLRSPSGAQVRLGNGDGSFQPPIELVLDGNQLTAADMNLDGIVDLVAVDGAHSAAVVLLGRGDGTFEPEIAFPVLPGPVSFVVGDFNGDDSTDLVAAGEGSMDLTVLLNTTPISRVAPNGIVNGASFVSSPVSPGEIITISGTNLGPQHIATARVSTPGFVDTFLEGTRVLFDGVPAPLIYTRADQVAAVVPYSVSGKTATRMQVLYGQARAPIVALGVTATNPGIFTADSSGLGAAAALNQDGSVNSPANPAAKGSIITFWATGVGQTNPPGIDGQLAQTPLPTPVLPVIVGIADMGAEATYIGAAPGFLSGLVQINARVPKDAYSGPHVPLVILVGDVFSQPGVTIAVR